MRLGTAFPRRKFPMRDGPLRPLRAKNEVLNSGCPYAPNSGFPMRPVPMRPMRPYAPYSAIRPIRPPFGHSPLSDDWAPTAGFLWSRLALRIPSGRRVSRSRPAFHELRAISNRLESRRPRGAGRIESREKNRRSWVRGGREHISVERPPPAPKTDSGALQKGPYFQLLIFQSYTGIELDSVGPCWACYKIDYNRVPSRRTA